MISLTLPLNSDRYMMDSSEYVFYYFGEKNFIEAGERVWNSMHLVLTFQSF